MNRQNCVPVLLSALVICLVQFTVPATFAQAPVEKGAEVKKGRRVIPDRPGGVGPEFEVKSFTGSLGVEMKYGWLAPAKIESDKKYPLVLCLHGAGGTTSAPAVLAGAKLREQYPCFIMAPATNPGVGWTMNDGIRRRPTGPIKAEAPRQEMLAVAVEAIRELMKTAAIDPARIYVTGQSMGGIGTWGAAARHPDFFAAAVPICGAWNKADGGKMKSIPIWAFHGDADPTVPVKFSRELTEAVKQAGGTAKYTEYPGVGHDSWTAAYADAELWAWLFQQRKAGQ